MKIKQFVPFLLLLSLAFTACDSSSKPASPAAKPAPKPDEYVTGQVAFQKMLISARSFGPDVQPYLLESEYTPGAPVTEGKAGIWRASFASPSRHYIKTFTWSGLTGPDRGINSSVEGTYSPANSSTQIFNIAFLSTDSSKAFAVAQEHGGKKLMEQDLKQPVSFALDWDARGSRLVWRVIYGTSRDSAQLRVAVDASTGTFLRMER